jgi:hypothetical protein
MLKSGRAGLFFTFKYTCVICAQSNIRALVKRYEPKCIWELTHAERAISLLTALNATCVFQDECLAANRHRSCFYVRSPQ